MYHFDEKEDLEELLNHEILNWGQYLFSNPDVLYPEIAYYLRRTNHLIHDHMKKPILTLAPMLISCFLFTACIENTGEDSVDVTATEETEKEEVYRDNHSGEEIDPEKEGKLRTFLHSVKNTYGWQTGSDEIMLDFFEDGRLAIQGADGEAAMWEGTWDLMGDQLTMKRPDLNKTITVTAEKNGNKLILDGVEYTRYRAQ